MYEILLIKKTKEKSVDNVMFWSYKPHCILVRPSFLYFSLLVELC